MYKKICTECEKPSYSSCDSGTWLCPVCGADITKVNLHAPESQRGQNQVELLSGQYIKQQGNQKLYHELV
ncbi:hypothetical protein AM500_10710 [Bacillus sp. FJAT-18017]|uniref:hypothetical protein n=1 Tax=Bacillus sp. FJAT-18017 TaxID=1705566 RepID=UPI0006AE3E89|nr:hypothetical protein [Bacillus sp. FJAT-18017]ALC90202.1 hypothetical protein AM500_10710 [Bacillus sp. FJAT-18017]